MGARSHRSITIVSSFVIMKSPFVLFGAHLLLALSLSGQTDQLYCTLDLPTDTIMVGQPVHFRFHLRNQGKNPVNVLYDSQGTYWNDIGRDETFHFNCYDGQGHPLEARLATENQIIVVSKFVGFQLLEQTDSLDYVEWLEDWFTIDTPGKYTLECVKTITIKENKVRTEVEQRCQTSCVVIPFDTLLLDAQIAHLWTLIHTPRIEKRYWVESLARIQSKRVIPYLRTLIFGSGSDEKVIQGIKGLSKFTEDSLAFQTIASILQPDCPILSDAHRPDLIESQMKRIRGFALKYSAQFYPDLSVPLLLELNQHPDIEIRKQSLYQLFHLKPELARSVIEERLSDKNEEIRSHAEWLHGWLPE